MNAEPTDRERWDAKYAADPDWALPRPPDAFALRAFELVAPPGRAVDLAGGNGRHALELARRGWQVEVWDASPIGLSLAKRAAAADGLEIETRCVDLLRDRPLSADPRFDLAVVVNFRDKVLLEELPRIVCPGGHVVYCHYTTDWPKEKPPMRFRLAPGELEQGLPDLELLLHEERDGRAGVLCRLP
jgi:SAM-dependent methyltransferase